MHTYPWLIGVNIPKWYEESRKDDYFIEIWNTWNELAMECFCSVCLNNQHSTNVCETVLKQRQYSVPLRSCPFCKNNIPEKVYEDKSDNGHIKILSSSEITCHSCQPLH